MRIPALLSGLSLVLALLVGCGDAAEPGPVLANWTPFTTAGLVNTPLFSPDGTEVAYGWRDRDGFSGLMLQSLGGSDPLVLYRDHNEIVPLEWSADGDYILVAIRSQHRPDNLVLVSRDGFLRRLVGGERTQ